MARQEWERQLLAAISADEMGTHLERICSWDRLSGGPGEAAAVDYVVDVLRGYGVPVEVHAFEAYLSNPVLGRVELLGSDRPIKAKTRAFSASTGEEGVVGELVYIPGGSDMFRDLDTKERIQALDLRGKVVLSEGGGRANMIAAQAGGAVGYIHMWPSDEDYVHEGTVSPVWGSPTPESFALLPRIPVVQVTAREGGFLREHVGSKVRLTTRTENGFRTLRLPVAEIRGAGDDFVLIGGHIDSWHLGATDNGTGNAACLELARVLHRFRDRLRRSVRIAWWPGHSNGRYAGSTWYCDRFWQDLHDHCVAYINVDSPGALGATDYSVITAAAETAALGVQVVQELTGQRARPERPFRAGDQSFWGPGVSSLYMLLSNRPEGRRAAVGGSGMGWWWHTEEDTLDKVDRDVLLCDTRIYALAAFRLATADVLPLQPDALAAEMLDELASLHQRAAGHLDLFPAITRLTELREALSRVGSPQPVPEADSCAAAAGTARDDAGRAVRARPDPDTLNRMILQVIRALTPVNYTVSGPYDHDPAIPARPVPGLADAPRLAALPPDSDEYRFLRTRLIRQRNRVVAAADRALEAVRSTLGGAACGA